VGDEKRDTRHKIMDMPIDTGKKTKKNKTRNAHLKQRTDIVQKACSFIVI
jgi:hypothetical protein